MLRLSVWADNFTNVKREEIRAAGEFEGGAGESVSRTFRLQAARVVITPVTEDCAGRNEANYKLPRLNGPPASNRNLMK